MKRSDLDKFKDFGLLMGYKIEEVNISETPWTIVGYNDSEKASNVVTKGYDEIYFLGVFMTDTGKMVEAYNISHVSFGPMIAWDKYKELIKHFKHIKL